MFTQSGKSRFLKGKRTCPICSNTHHYHCSVTDDGALAICSNVPSDKQASDGRYIHRLKDTPRFDPRLTAAPAPALRECGNAEPERAEPERAEPARLNDVYSALLSDLELSGEHGDNLLERGLSDTVIAANLYATVPGEAEGDHVAFSLARNFDLTGVPGFYRGGGSWRLNTFNRGYFIPYRNHRGLILGLQIRLDDDSNGKSRWLSTADRPGGAGPSTPLHFAAPTLARSTGEVIVTEGALKADIISQYAEASVVAVAGVKAVPAAALAQILRGVFSPHLRRVVLAFDADWRTNPQVRAALIGLKEKLIGEGLPVVVRTWDAAMGKGYDDALVREFRGVS